MTGDIAYDSRRIFRHACAFADCASFCEKEPNSLIIPTQWYTTPDIVNSAFACEVFIKSLLIYHGMTIDEIKGHKLSLLWELLKQKDEEITIRIKETVIEIFNSDEEKFYSMLENISNAFEYWRYIYEKHGGKIHINFLRIFRETLRNACCKQIYNQTWDEYVSDKKRQNAIKIEEDEE